MTPLVLSSQIPFSLPLVTLSFLSFFFSFFFTFLSFSLLLYMFFFLFFFRAKSHPLKDKNLSPPHPWPLFSDLPVVLCPSPFPRWPIWWIAHKCVSISDPLISKIKKQTFQFQYHSPPRKNIFIKLQKSPTPTLLKTTKHKANYILVPPQLLQAIRPNLEQVRHLVSPSDQREQRHKIRPISLQLGHLGNGLAMVFWSMTDLTRAALANTPKLVAS